MKVQSRGKALKDTEAIQPVKDSSLLRNINLYTGTGVNPNAGLLELLLGGHPVRKQYRR